ncbi:PTS sugar transporter subunit IIC [Ligilactobacillus sp. WILCCON 0076]|uniref:PTS sugar transporter subunit IIC n=1 Tax=Ligilactobacillus ubinensis TaxID=2876789 RepID=A0A9X2FLQ7_9LACO|nr:PTS sugar transporter subunit IIC [Ligilactobacillus ubinensis]MCP0888037.1 PTS sugar transporter subunit IIC [Ligilactobacillus ubinensis]
MGLTALQVILITGLAYFKTLDISTTQIFAFDTIIFGAITGLILGDFKTGLVTGATLQLMSLGVAALGGASMPDYPVAAIIATTIAITTGKGMAAGLALGVPVGMLCINFDVLLKLINSAFARKAQSYAKKKEFKKMTRIIPIMTLLYPLQSAVPVFLAIVFGKPVVEAILNFMPDWFTVGLNVAGGMLPAVGIAMLLTYMPLKKYGYWLLIGFVLAAYLKLATLGLGLLGIAAAIPTYRQLVAQNESKKATNNVGSGLNEEDMQDE